MNADSNVQLQMWIYYLDRAEKPNGPQAVYWLRRAAYSGVAEAQFRLWQCFESGLGTVEDLPNGAYWYQKAAEQRHAEAAYRMGLYCNNFLYSAYDKNKAILWHPAP